jgi:hypothetical protein
MLNIIYYGNDNNTTNISLTIQRMSLKYKLSTMVLSTNSCDDIIAYALSRINKNNLYFLNVSEKDVDIFKKLRSIERKCYLVLIHKDHNLLNELVHHKIE